MLEITQEKLDQLYVLSDEVTQKQDLASEILRTAQDRGNENKIEVEREGRKVTVKEKHLWDEVWALGKDCDAAKELTVKYPEVFAAWMAHDEVAGRFKSFVLTNFGVDYTAMKFSDYVKLMDAMIEYKLKNR